MANPSYTYGGLDFNNGAYTVLEKPKSLVPFVQTLYKVARFEGMKKTSEEVNERTLQVKVFVASTATPPTRADLEAQLDTLYQALAKRNQQLVLYALDSRYFLADCISADTILGVGNVVSAMCNITFVARAPWAFSPTSSTTTQSGITYTLLSGTTYTSGTLVTTGGGTIFARPTLHIVSNNNAIWSQIDIHQNTDNTVLSITNGSGSLPNHNGDYLDVVCAPNATNGWTAMTNGAGPLLPVSGLFPVIEPGSTNWVFKITTGGAAANTDITWTWTNRWL